MNQKIFTGKNINERFVELQKEKHVQKLFVVCGSFCKKLEIAKEILNLPVEEVWFSDFTPNPEYESVKKGVELFREKGCDAVLAIGGGSAMDVAKCIKLYSSMNADKNYLEQQPQDNGVPLIAIPTTAGTGSEATRFAVIYYQGNKQSVTHDSIIPEYVFFRSEVLKGLPEYQKKVTMMDAMCHAIESFWSVNSTDESRIYSRDAINKIMSNMDGYLSGDEKAAKEMLIAANIAGKAINITQTTAGHAMCYKITSLYEVSHGHAASLCVSKLWTYMIEHIADCIDPRGKEHLQRVFKELADAFECEFVEEAAEKFGRILKKLDLRAPLIGDGEQLKDLVSSVNPTRLKNNPVLLTEDTLKDLYIEILRG